MWPVSVPSQNYNAHADRVNRGLLQFAAKKEHHRRAKGRQQGNQPDVFEKEHE
jgi:hypothetical protein